MSKYKDRANGEYTRQKIDVRTHKGKLRFRRTVKDARSFSRSEVALQDMADTSMRSKHPQMPLARLTRSS